MIYNVYMFCLLIFAKILKSIMSLFRRAINFFFSFLFFLGDSGQEKAGTSFVWFWYQGTKLHKMNREVCPFLLFFKKRLENWC